MATHYPDYRQLVMRAFERKKKNSTLPHGLMHLKPAKVKEECVKKCTKEVNRRDEKIIRDFCGDLNEERSCHDIMQRCDRDKFRPLINYLNGRSESTDEKNIELLAWLIDFPGRPWELGKTYSGDDDENGDPVLNEATPATVDQETAPGSPATPLVAGRDELTGNPIIPENPAIPFLMYSSKEKEGAGVKVAETSNQKKLRGRSTRTLAAAVILSLALGTGGMWWWKDNPRPGGNCMYWQEDHYEPVACNQKIANGRVIAADTMKLKNFRKITRPDTITYQAIGKVWYSKINDKIEYYTAGGEHPVVFGRQLKPITVYIIDKYIRGMNE
ncbi:hypothetical protein QFZ48_004035 [Chitinophaga sp. W2I13]